MTLPTPGRELAAAFDAAAEHYDLLVALSPGYHAQLADSARALVRRLPDAGALVLDLGCGTGASTAALLRALNECGRSGVRIEGVDASAGMIARAHTKA